MGQLNTREKASRTEHSGDEETEVYSVRSKEAGRAEDTRLGLIGRVRAWFRGTVVTPFVTSRNPPWFDARGVAVGLAIGLGVPVGAQFASMIMLRTVFRYNMVLAFVASWVSNPFTMLLQYYFYYVIGSKMLGEQAVMTRGEFRDLMMPILQMDYFWESVQAFMLLGGDFLVRWCAAGFVLAIIGSIIGYILAYRAQFLRCKRKAKKMGITYEKLVEDLERRALTEESAPE